MYKRIMPIPGTQKFVTLILLGRGRGRVEKLVNSPGFRLQK